MSARATGSILSRWWVLTAHEWHEVQVNLSPARGLWSVIVGAHGSGRANTPDARGLCWVEDEVIACREFCSDIDVLGREMGLVVGWGVVAYAAALLERTIGLHWAVGAACQLRQAGPGEMLGGGSIEGFRPGVGYKPDSGRR